MTTAAKHSDLIEGEVEAVGGDKLVLKVPGTHYRLVLEIEPGATPRPITGERITGRIHAKARRIDAVGAGGRFVEPVYGRPRRAQGRVRAYDAQANRVMVWAGLPMIIEPTAVNQKPENLAPGGLVGFDVEPGARFEPIDG